MNANNLAKNDARRLAEFHKTVALLGDGLASGCLDETLYKDLMKNAYLGLPSNDRSTMTSTVNFGIFRTSFSEESSPKELSNEKK